MKRRKRSMNHVRRHSGAAEPDLCVVDSQDLFVLTLKMS